MRIAEFLLLCALMAVAAVSASDCGAVSDAIAAVRNATGTCASDSDCTSTSSIPFPTIMKSCPRLCMSPASPPNEMPFASGQKAAVETAIAALAAAPNYSECEPTLRPPCPVADCAKTTELTWSIGCDGEMKCAWTSGAARMSALTPLVACAATLLLALQLRLAP